MTWKRSPDSKENLTFMSKRHFQRLLSKLWEVKQKFKWHRIWNNSSSFFVIFLSLQSEASPGTCFCCQRPLPEVPLPSQGWAWEKLLEPPCQSQQSPPPGSCTFRPQGVQIKTLWMGWGKVTRLFQDIKTSLMLKIKKKTTSLESRKALGHIRSLLTFKLLPSTLLLGWKKISFPST